MKSRICIECKKEETNGTSTLCTNCILKPKTMSKKVFRKGNLKIDKNYYSKDVKPEDWEAIGKDFEKVFEDMDKVFRRFN